jgi:hypothetical protein
MMNLTWRAQEIPFDDPRSMYMFSTDAKKAFVATTAAVERFGREAILKCLYFLQELARKEKGLAYVQIFDAEDGGEALWFADELYGDGVLMAFLASEN